jgi:antitoxin (DNA-binding transcriptional repressor) of toxin-antitoxin stability system
VKGSRGCSWPVVTADGTGVVSHAGTVLLRELAERAGLRAEFSVALDGLRRRGGGHDPGQVLVDVAVTLADGGEAIADIAGLADQPDLHGPVASPATAWRVLAGVDRGRLAGLRQARAAARERAWLARGEVTGRVLPPARAAGRDLDYVVLDIDATLIEAHSEKEQASAHFKGGFGFHPMLCFLDNTNEAVAGVLRTGGAGSNTAADHITVLGLALAQLPETARAGRILVRTDGAGFSHAFVEDLVGLGLEYSIGYAVTDDVRAAITALPTWAWTDAVTADGGLRDGAQVVEITDQLTEVARLGAARRRRDRTTAGLPERTEKVRSWPAGMRVIVRRERPHPGAQLDLVEERDGYRYQAFATNTAVGQLAFLEARHRAHARVEDRIRQTQHAGLGRLPSRLFTVNAVWLELALTAADLLAWTQTILLTEAPDLARAEWKTIRYRLLHTAARITRTARRVHLRLQTGWPWALALARAFTLLRRIPVPATA